jgi:molybdopterin-guanine dinucleotide biosynthesis protein A
MIKDCTALILAGGDSRRMGQDKAALVLDGKTLLEHVTATMQQVFPKVIVSVRQLRSGVEVPQVCDEQEAGGPLAGLIAGLAQADTPWVFAVACDMPFVTARVIEKLAEFRYAALSLPLGRRKARMGVESSGDTVSTPTLTFPLHGGGDGISGCQAVVPIVGGYPQPLAAFYATSALDAMRANFAAGDKSMRGVLDRFEVRYVSEAELRAADPQLRSFFDLDTPQDFQAAQK